VSLALPGHTEVENVTALYKGMLELARQFDVAIVGAGAYSIPVLAHAKLLGKFAIHLGGAVQILFGIKGRRWDSHEIGSRFYNNYWSRPLEEETPKNTAIIEDSCYW